MRRRAPQLRRDDRFKRRDLDNARIQTARRAWRALVEQAGLLVEPDESLSAFPGRGPFGFDQVALTRGATVATAGAGQDRAWLALAGQPASVSLSLAEATPAGLLAALRRLCEAAA